MKRRVRDGSFDSRIAVVSGRGSAAGRIPWSVLAGCPQGVHRNCRKAVVRGQWLVGSSCLRSPANQAVCLRQCRERYTGTTVERGGELLGNQFSAIPANAKMVQGAFGWVQRARALEEFSGCFYGAALPMEEGECAQSLGKARRKEGSLHGLREMEY